MEILDIKEGFPDISGHVMHNHVEFRSSGSIMLWFHRLDADLNSLREGGAHVDVETRAYASALW